MIFGEVLKYLNAFNFVIRQNYGSAPLASSLSDKTPRTQGKIERRHQTMKNRVLLENYYLPGDLERQIDSFVEYYNNQRYHESLDNVTPADVYFGRDKTIIRERKKIKRSTINQRRLQHFRKAA